jgi:outer membrane protein assembly factor BamB
MVQQRWSWCWALVLGAAACLQAADTRQGADWPQWRGPHRDAVSADTGLLRQWPKKGPPLVWKATGLGRAYSSVSVAGGRIFTMGDRPGRAGSRGGEDFVIALNEADGKELWATRLADAWSDGPRCTPTVDHERVYALAPQGSLVCLEAESGKEIWRKHLVNDFRGQVGGWAYCESPLVDGDKLVCTPGGKDATLIALNKKTGETIWQAKVPEGDAAGYSSIVVADLEGEREYIQFLGGGVVGVSAKDGTFLWRYNAPANGTANCSTPVYHDHLVFAASAYGTGGGLARLTRRGNHVKAEQVYFAKDMQNHHGGMLLVDGYLYGEGGGRLFCLDFKTGKVMWESGKPGKGSIAYADGHLYYRNEGGPITLVEAKPDKYVEAGRFDQPHRSGVSAWPHPAIAHGKLYIRDQDVLLCFDVTEH